MLINYQIWIDRRGKIMEVKDLATNTYGIVGSIAFDISDTTTEAFLFDLNVNEDFQGEGYATTLRNFAIGKILSEGATQIKTTAHSYNEEFPQEDLEKFYVKNFEENGAHTVAKIGPRILASF